jgi:hypothetical protein
MNNQVAVFVDNRFSNIKTRLSRIAYKKFNAPPSVEHKRVYWYNKRWEVTKASGAVPALCGWCGQITPAYPININGSDGTICLECGRGVDEFHRGWFYRAEYSDGCKVRLCNGLLSQVGAGHGVLENHEEIPIYEFLHPLLFSAGKKFTQEEFCLFFRECAKKSKIRLDESDISIFIKSLEFPHRPIDVLWF